MYLEGKLEERVAALLPEVRVFTDPDLEQLVTRFSRANGGKFVSIIFGGPTPVGKGTGEEQDVAYSVFVVVGVKNVRDAAGQAARSEAQPLVDTLMAGLLNWWPGEHYSRLQLAPPPRPSFQDGFQLIPLAFTCRVTVRGQPY